MKNFLSMLGFLIVLALIGGGAWFAYQHFAKEEESPEAKACQAEKTMITSAVEQANLRGSSGGLTDPSAYYTANVDLKYYRWGGVEPNFEVQTIGSPPC